MEELSRGRRIGIAAAEGLSWERRLMVEEQKTSADSTKGKKIGKLAAEALKRPLKEHQKNTLFNWENM